MRRILLLLMTILIYLAPVAYAYPYENREVEPFTWDKQYLKQLHHVNIPVYVPSCIATSEFHRIIGPLTLSKLEVSKDHYLFQISRQKAPKGNHARFPFDVMTMSAGTLPDYRKQPFATFEMFHKPEGTTTFNGYDVDYFTDKTSFIWKSNGWEYLVSAKNTNNAVNIMKQVMATIPKSEQPVQDAVKGQFTAFDTNAGVQSDAAWSYDNGATWYIVTGRTTPEQLVKVLRSMVKLDTP
ncbi:hypothetical protein [Paenibacillus macquariensis]|uniref:DUF4367 domain-containing protein n=1 Tax=Paenibacillus macquariensis TaxID=948756 RepID=A0ABY1KAG8_9BACL|nr:hypothetical protein [Paenibacillus macquariensis]MEC0093690.1 hypothetical protein [Paenibacillus macquariensis]OAB31641.1 hypothetical protein PMSM_19400 [Paenibacillus macquariensis subsp. macquariensis]SIR50835.1 hypothetical protein SAMN05421578_116100 [Paenibacillus macquariensis]